MYHVSEQDTLRVLRGKHLAWICTSSFQFRIEGRSAALGDRDFFANFETRQ
jgi:hypothetical protein